jgi:hypothetical protein
MIAQNKKKLNFILCLTIMGTLVTQSFNVQQQQPKKLKNIKVFPASFTYEQVDHAMDEFKVDLGVKCNYCHAPEKDNPRKNDFPSDDNPKKDIARQMMRMTDEMNKKYMATIRHTEQDTAMIQLVTCNTCHRGVPKPFGKPLVAPAPLPAQNPKPAPLGR